MKKLIPVFLTLLVLLSLSSCKKEYFYEEGTQQLYIDEYLVRAQGVTLDMALEMLKTYYTDEEAVIFVPRAGDYNSAKYGRFTVQVDSLCGVYLMENTELSRVSFHITVLDENGEVIVEKEEFNSYVEIGARKPDMTYVSEEFKPYWEVIAVRSDKLNP